jgi:hypothetical protein
MGKGTVLGILVLPILSSMAIAQSNSDCKGDLRKAIKTGPYDFVISSRYEDAHDVRWIYTCVKNRALGYFRFHWHVPGHRVDLVGVDADELLRPIGLTRPIDNALGCLSYGNLDEFDVGYFYADESQLKAVEREHRDGCPKTLSRTRRGEAELPLIPIAMSPNKIPRHLDYTYQSKFFVESPEKLKLHLELFLITTERPGTHRYLMIPMPPLIY